MVLRVHKYLSDAVDYIKLLNEFCTNYNAVPFDALLVCRRTICTIVIQITLYTISNITCTTSLKRAIK